MEQYVFFGFLVAVFLAQTAVCFFSKRVVIKLTPVLTLFVLMGICFAVYLATQNWAYLIFILILFLGLLVAVSVWTAYGLVKLIQTIVELSRKNT